MNVSCATMTRTRSGISASSSNEARPIARHRPELELTIVQLQELEEALAHATNHGHAENHLVLFGIDVSHTAHPSRKDASDGLAQESSTICPRSAGCLEQGRPGFRLTFHRISAVGHARRSWLLASFSLRSDAHVLKYAPLRSSRKPRQKPGLAGGVADRSG